MWTSAWGNILYNSKFATSIKTICWRYLPLLLCISWSHCAFKSLCLQYNSYSLSIIRILEPHEIRILETSLNMIHNLLLSMCWIWKDIQMADWTHTFRFVTYSIIAISCNSKLLLLSTYLLSRTVSHLPGFHFYWENWLVLIFMPSAWKTMGNVSLLYLTSKARGISYEEK